MSNRFDRLKCNANYFLRHQTFNKKAEVELNHPKTDETICLRGDLEELKQKIFEQFKDWKAKNIKVFDWKGGTTDFVSFENAEGRLRIEVNRLIDSGVYEVESELTTPFYSALLKSEPESFAEKMNFHITLPRALDRDNLGKVFMASAMAGGRNIEHRSNGAHFSIQEIKNQMKTLFRIKGAALKDEQEEG